MAVPYAIEITKKALGLYGAEENPRGSNILPVELQKVCACAGWRERDRAPWCLYFALGVVRFVWPARNVIPAHLAKEGSTGEFLRRAAAAGKVIDQPAYGAVAIFLKPSGTPFHAGICLGPSEVYEGHAVHIEGNTNDEGDPEGYEVCVRHRPIRDTRWVVW